VPDEILVIGYGNTLRGDDGIGPAVAEQVARLGLSGVRVIVAHQLTPELAADLADARLAVFLDAATGGERVTTARLDWPTTTPDSLTHAADPRGLVALTRAVYNRVPETWLVTAAGADFGFREGLSPTGRANAREALGHVRWLILEAAGP
jgi:hydrogenase maturation protease